MLNTPSDIPISFLRISKTKAPHFNCLRPQYATSIQRRTAGQLSEDIFRGTLNKHDVLRFCICSHNFESRRSPGRHQSLWKKTCAFSAHSSARHGRGYPCSMLFKVYQACSAKPSLHYQPSIAKTRRRFEKRDEATDTTRRRSLLPLLCLVQLAFNSNA